jgi:hypothetical protein
MYFVIILNFFLRTRPPSLCIIGARFIFSVNEGEQDFATYNYA